MVCAACRSNKLTNSFTMNTTKDTGAMHELHKLVMDAKSKNELVEGYAKWAPVYDDDVLGDDYVGFKVVVRRLQAEMSSDTFREILKTRKVRIFDAGCGTGLCSLALGDIKSRLDGQSHIIGADISPEMLDVAGNRNFYDELMCLNLNDADSIPNFDMCVSSGVFLDGHCKANALGNLLEKLTPRGLASVTVRNIHFTQSREEYLNVIRENNCEILRNDVLNYLSTTLANYVVIRKLEE